MKLIDADLLKIAINHERYHGGFKVKDVTQIIDEQLAVNAIVVSGNTTNKGVMRRLFSDQIIEVRERDTNYTHEVILSMTKDIKDWWDEPYRKVEE